MATDTIKVVDYKTKIQKPSFSEINIIRIYIEILIS